MKVVIEPRERSGTADGDKRGPPGDSPANSSGGHNEPGETP